MLYGLLFFPANRHYLRIRKGCAYMHKNTPCTAAHGEFPEHPLFDLRQTTLNHFNWMNDNSRTDPEQTAFPDFLNCFSKQRFRFPELAYQQSRCRKRFLRRDFAFLPAFDMAQPESILPDLHIEGVGKESGEHGGVVSYHVKSGGALQYPAPEPGSGAFCFNSLLKFFNGSLLACRHVANKNAAPGK